MKTVSVTAHFDGQHIQLDEPLDLAPNTKLMVTVLSEDAEREAWLKVSARGLARAYADNEEGYDSSDIKMPNPDYDRG